MPKRKNPKYPPWHCFTTVKCDKCGEHYEPICELKHICKKQNSYQIKEEDNNAVEKANIIINRLQADVENYRQIAEHQQSVTLDRGFEIKRLKEKIESLQAENKRLSTLAELGKQRANDYRVMRDRALKAEAENERLQSINDNFTDIGKLYSEIKAEAVKEFAEKVKQNQRKLFNYINSPTGFGLIIDGLVEELVGEGNGG